MELDIGRSSRRRTDLKAGDGNYTSVIKVDVQVREPCDFTEPVFILTRFNNYESCNYIYVAHWSRYYFINEITVNGNLIELHCVEDYLASWYSQIASQSLFCTRSASDPNLALADNTFPRESKTERVETAFDSPYTAGINNGVFVLAVNGNQPIVTGGGESNTVNAYIGTTNYYILEKDTMASLAKQLYSTSIIKKIEYMWNDPMDYFMRCYFLPFTIDDLSPYIQPTSEYHEIVLGSISIDNIEGTIYIWKSPYSTTTIYPLFEKTDNIYPDSSFFNRSYEFENHAPYSHMYLMTYPDGLREVGDNFITAFYNSSVSDPMKVDYALDITNGTLLVQFIKNNTIIYYTTIKASVEIQLAELTYNYGDVLKGIGTIAAGAFLGAVGAGAATAVGGTAALSGIVNSFNAMLSPELENRDQTSGGFNTLNTTDWSLIRTYNPVNLYPAAYGLPCCKIETLGNLTGFAQFEPVNIKTANGMLAKEQAEIEALLRRGVFINE